MRSDVVSNAVSVPVGFELAIGVVVAGVNAGFSRISGVSSPRVAAIYSLGSTIGIMLFRHGVDLGVEYLGSALGLSEGLKTGGKVVSELVIGHGVGQMMAQDLFRREVTYLDALKLRAGTTALLGAITAVAFAGMQMGSSSRVEPERDEEFLALLQKIEQDLAAANVQMQLIGTMLLENSTQVI